jgi:hypothetical protein
MAGGAIVDPRSSAPFRAAAGIAAAIAWLVCAGASAHPLVDEGRAAYEEAEFVAALAALSRAEAAADLSIEDLVELYELRAVVHLAMRNEEAMSVDLRRLVAVAPEHAIDTRAPPEVRRAFEEARAASGGPLRLVVEARARESGVTISAETRNDSENLVREIRIAGRTPGADAWEEVSDAPLLVAADGVVEYYVEAIGPGGAVLASRGSADDPLRAAPEDATAPEIVEEDGGVSGWVFVGIGAGVLAVAGAAVALFFVLSPDADTQLGAFQVDYGMP